jgi:hypothetical protein
MMCSTGFVALMRSCLVSDVWCASLCGLVATICANISPTLRLCNAVNTMLISFYIRDSNREGVVPGSESSCRCLQWFDICDAWFVNTSLASLIRILASYMLT